MRFMKDIAQTGRGSGRTHTGLPSDSFLPGLFGFGNPFLRTRHLLIAVFGMTVLLEILLLSLCGEFIEEILAHFLAALRV